MLQGGTSTIATIFLIVNAALGAGLLNFPKAFDQAGGVLVAVLVQVIPPLRERVHFIDRKSKRFQ